MSATGFYHIDTANASGGTARWLISPYASPHPTKIADIFALTTPWAPAYATYGWIDLGLTDAAAQTRHGFAQQAWRAEQTGGPFRTQPGDWTAEVQCEFLEVVPQASRANLYNAQLAADDAASEHVTVYAADTVIPFVHLAIGWRDDLTSKYHAWYFPKAQWNGSQVQMAIQHGEMIKMPITWSVFPDSTYVAPNGNYAFRIDFDQP